MPARGIKAILFDLGGVLIRLGGISQMMAWTHLDRDGFWRRWLASAAVRQYEAGQIPVDEFGRRVVRELNLPVSAEEFLTQFAKWPQGLFHGAEELLVRVGHKYQLGCLSNTNSLHWTYLTEETKLTEYFDYLLPSHLTGQLKPDQSAFINATTTLKLQPEEILFLDDNQINVDAAVDTGMKGYLVHRVDGANKLLNQLNII